MSLTGYPEPSLRIFRFTTHPEDTPTGPCDVCDSLDGVEVEERLICGAFPNAELTDENSYDVHVHKTCVCTLDMVEDNQPSEPEIPETQPNMFTYWINKDTKREDVNLSQTSSTPSKFAYWRDKPGKTEAEKTPPKPKSDNVPAKTITQPKSTVNLERPEEVKPPEQQLDETPDSSEPEAVKLLEEPAQDLEVAQQAPPEKLATNERALSKLVYWPSKDTKSKEEPPAAASSITEEIKPSEPDIAVPQPELVTPQLSRPVSVSTQVYYKPPERDAAEAPAEITPRLMTLQKSTVEIPLETNAVPFAYWSNQPPRPATESFNTNEVNLQQQPQLYGLPEPQQSLALPEPVAPPETPVLPKLQHSTRKTPVHYFSYWAQGHMPNTEPEGQLPQEKFETENVAQYGYYAQPTFDAETLEKTFAKSKVSDEVVENVTPKVAQKMAKLAYWNPADSNAGIEDGSDVEGDADEEAGDEGESDFAGVPVKLSPRRVFHAFKNVHNLQKIGLHSIVSSGGINPATAAVASMLIPLISELVRVEVELQLQAHNKQMEKERNAEYRSAYASVTPL